MTIGVSSGACACACCAGSMREPAAPAMKASAMEPRKRARFIESLPGICLIATRTVIPGEPDTQGRTLHISIADITNAFPDYRVAFVVAEGLTIAPERPASLDALIAEREAATRARWSGTELAQIAGIA